MLAVRIKPRAARQIDQAAEWWAENRRSAPGAIRQDIESALSLLVVQPGIGTKVEIPGPETVRWLCLGGFTISCTTVSPGSSSTLWSSGTNAGNSRRLSRPMTPIPFFKRTRQGLRPCPAAQFKHQAPKSMLTIHRALPSDVTTMHAIQMRAFDEEGRRCGTRDIPPLQEQIAAIAEHVQTQIALVCKEGDRTVGCVRGVLDGRVCTIRALVVDPSKHGRGFGSALLRALATELKDIERVNLTTNTVMEQNVPFYERHGYRVIEYTTPRPGIRLAHMSKFAARAT